MFPFYLCCEFDQNPWQKIFSKFSSFSSHFWCKFCKLQNSFFDLIFESIRLKLEIYSLMVPFYLCCEFLYTSKFIFWPYFWIYQAETWNILFDGFFLSILWISSKSVTKKFWPNFQVFPAIFGAIFVHFKISFFNLNFW